LIINKYVYFQQISCEALQTLLLIFFPLGAHSLSCYMSLLATYFFSKYVLNNSL